MEPAQALSRDRCAAQACLLCHGKFVQVGCTSPKTQQLALAAEAALWSCRSLGAGRKLCAAPRSGLQAWKLLSSLIPSSVFLSSYSTWYQMLALLNGVGNTNNSSEGFCCVFFLLSQIKHLFCLQQLLSHHESEDAL